MPVEGEARAEAPPRCVVCERELIDHARFLRLSVCSTRCGLALTGSKRIRRHKYGVAAKSERTTAGGEVFDSKRELEYARYLDVLKASGEVVCYERQFSYRLPVVNLKLEWIRDEHYVADFVVHWKDGKTTVVDVKGFRTREYKRKKRRMRECYGVDIVEV